MPLAPAPLVDLRQYMVGLACFVMVCGVVIIDIVSSQPQPRVKWSSDEMNKLFKCLIHNRSKLTDDGTFKATMFHVTANYIGTDKRSKDVCSKWRALKRTFDSIVSYRHRSGCHWDNINGANISLPSEANDWDAHIKTVNGKQIAPFRNKGWAYYTRMQQIYTQGGTQDSSTYEPAHYVGYTDSDIDVETQTAFNFSLDELLRVGNDIASPEPVTQAVAVYNAVCMLQSVVASDIFSVSSVSRKRTFSELSEDESVLPPNMSDTVAFVSISSVICRIRDVAQGVVKPPTHAR